MLTLFCIPKPHVGHIGIIQANAINSWSRLPGCEVILFGDEEGVAEFAASAGLRHVPHIACNEFGTPLVSDAFEQACKLANKPLVAYVNADIVLTSDFLDAARKVAASEFRDFLLVGERSDIDIREPLNFSEEWEARLQADVARRGILHGKTGIDYFVFPSTFPIHLPPFAVGRPRWDNWLIYQTRACGIPVIDATDIILAVHQNHLPAYREDGDESRENARLAGGFYHMSNLRDANWRLTERGVVRPPFMRRVIGTLMFSRPVRLLLALKRMINAGAFRAG